MPFALEAPEALLILPQFVVGHDVVLWHRCVVLTCMLLAVALPALATDMGSGANSANTAAVEPLVKVHWWATGEAKACLKVRGVARAWLDGTSWLWVDT